MKQLTPQTLSLLLDSLAAEQAADRAERDLDEVAMKDVVRAGLNDPDSQATREFFDARRQLEISARAGRSNTQTSIDRMGGNYGPFTRVNRGAFIIDHRPDPEEDDEEDV